MTFLSEAAAATPRSAAKFPLTGHEVLRGKSSTYRVVGLIGEGRFGNVLTCVDLKTNDSVAIKIHKDSDRNGTQKELEMLQAISALDSEKKSLVRFIDNFLFEDLSCLVFEILDRSLWDLMVERQMKPLNLNQIRPIAAQLLKALEALKGIGIIHTDMKPDNIMLVNHCRKPFRVKLIDFGLALPVSRVKIGMNLQPLSYRAPEVTLGLPISEAIDVWGLGCVVAFLSFGFHLFPEKCAYQMMKTLCRLLGQPRDHLLDAAKYAYLYFSRREDSDPGWRLHFPSEYTEASGTETVAPNKWLPSARSLKDVVNKFRESGGVQADDRTAFLDLLKCLLQVDAGRRATPRKALEHTFITMGHLAEAISTSHYVEAAIESMLVAPAYESADSDGSEKGSETGNLQTKFGMTKISRTEVLNSRITAAKVLKSKPRNGAFLASRIFSGEFLKTDSEDDSPAFTATDDGVWTLECPCKTGASARRPNRQDAVQIPPLDVYDPTNPGPNDKVSKKHQEERRRRQEPEKQKLIKKRKRKRKHRRDEEATNVFCRPPAAGDGHGNHTCRKKQRRRNPVAAAAASPSSHTDKCKSSRDSKDNREAEKKNLLQRIRTSSNRFRNCKVRDIHRAAANSGRQLGVTARKPTDGDLEAGESPDRRRPKFPGDYGTVMSRLKKEQTRRKEQEQQTEVKEKKKKRKHHRDGGGVSRFPAAAKPDTPDERKKVQRKEDGDPSREETQAAQKKNPLPRICKFLRRLFSCFYKL